MRLRLRRLGQRVALHHVLFLGFTLIAAVPVALLGVWVQQSALQKEIASVRDMHRQVADNIVLALSNYVHDADAAFRMSIAALQRGDWQPEVVVLLNSMHFIMVQFCVFNDRNRNVRKYQNRF